MSDVKTQVMPELGEMFTIKLTNPPSSSDYVTALDYADKNAVSVNDSAFQSVYNPTKQSGSAYAATAEPVMVESVIVQEVPVFDFKKFAILGVVGFLAYKYIWKRMKK